jgi:hypothetical protein
MHIIFVASFTDDFPVILGGFSSDSSVYVGFLGGLMSEFD